MKTITQAELKSHLAADRPAFLGSRWVCDRTTGQRIPSAPGDLVAVHVCDMNNGEPFLGTHDEICPNGILAPDLNEDGTLKPEAAAEVLDAGDQAGDGGSPSVPE